MSPYSGEVPAACRAEISPKSRGFHTKTDVTHLTKVISSFIGKEYLVLEKNRSISVSPPLVVTGKKSLYIWPLICIFYFRLHKS
ncbi:MAG: hypothetical protein DRH50_12140 [Deltaproteobacteria bacterium]|nr:MAG: hypothetical protein DRH50_12140 [Deltaproteobacteria bacterium]